VYDIIKLMKIDIEKFKNHKYIKHQTHPVFPLFIFNYTRECQYEDGWDEYTKMSRGLITTEDGEIIARPFKKFFNVGEKEHTKFENLPDEVPDIYEKLDGSLGILYWWRDTPFIATRGSFTSDQAMWATNWFYENVDKYELSKNVTYLFEIIYPENRIVVNYGDREDLVLLGMKDIETGKEFNYINEAKHLGLSYAKEYKDLSLKEAKDLMKELDHDREGFVVKFSDNFRVKMKGDEYVRLHRIVTDLNSKRIWEHLREGDSIKELIEEVPDEYYDWIKDWENKLKADFFDIQMKARYHWYQTLEMETRKEKALYLKENAKDVMGIVFKMIDNDRYEDLIWKKIEPECEAPKLEPVDN